VGAVSAVSVVPLETVPDIELPNGSFSRMLVTADRARGATASLGYSVFRPGTELGSVAHETEEFAFVASGTAGCDSTTATSSSAPATPSTFRRGSGTRW